MVEEIRYEYEQDEEGESIGSKGYRNGKLFAEVYQILDESGEVQGLAMVSYEENGSKSICEYDQYFDLVKETVYDAAGNVISES